MRLTFVKPYSVKRKPQTLFGSISSIYFEDTELFTNLTRENAEAIVGALNGAYNLGRSLGRGSEQVPPPNPNVGNTRSDTPPRPPRRNVA